MRFPGRLENVQEPGDVRIHVGVRVLDGVTYPRLGRQVHDPVRSMAVERRVPGSPVGDVDLLEREARQTLEASQAILRLRRTS